MMMMMTQVTGGGSVVNAADLASSAGFRAHYSIIILT